MFEDKKIICRVCMGNEANTSLFTPASSVILADKIMACTNVQVLLNDGFSSRICNACIEKLENAFEFKTICESSDFEMRQLISMKDEDFRDESRSSQHNILKIKIEDDNDDNHFDDVFDTMHTSEIRNESLTMNTDIQPMQTKRCKQEDKSNTKNKNRLTIQDKKILTKQSIESKLNTSLQQLLAEQEHKVKIVERGSFKCDDCGRVCPTLSSYKLHMRVHTGERPFKCEHCSSTFALNSTLQVHTRMHTGEKPYTCHECGNSFRHKSHLTNHSRTHSGIKPFQCPHCPKSFSQKAKVTNHIRTHTDERPFVCSYCGKAFSCKDYLTDHNRIHTKKQPYKCKICGKSFSNNSNIRVHMRVHTGEKPYECDICQKRFSQLDNMTIHKNRHLGLKPHICECCDKSFYCKSHLTRHKKLHLKTLPEQEKCEVCCKWVSDIDNHVADHQTEKKFPCNLCEKKFNWRNGLSRHLSKVHKNVPSQDNEAVLNLTDAPINKNSNLLKCLELSNNDSKKLTDNKIINTILMNSGVSKDA